jgi:endonuclease-3
MARSLAVREATNTYAQLRLAHPDAHCELAHDSPFQLLVAVVLSAQTTDVAVNQLTPALFRRWPGPEALARADVLEVEQALSRIGMFRQKAKNITRLAQKLVEEHGGEVPRSLEALVELRTACWVSPLARPSAWWSTLTCNAWPSASAGAAARRPSTSKPT